MSKRKERDGEEISSQILSIVPADFEVSNVSASSTSDVAEIQAPRRRAPNKISRKDKMDESFEELLDYGSSFRLLREDLLTLGSDKMVGNMVVECWCLLLNELESKDKMEPSRFFFGLGHMEAVHDVLQQTDSDTSRENKMFDFWDSWIQFHPKVANLNDIDLVFIPMEFKQHYSLIVVNFKGQTIDLLDYKKTTSSGKTNAEIVVNSFQQFLLHHHHPHASAFTKFKYNDVSLPWQSKTENADSGVYLMIHCLNYDGEEFEARLQRANDRKMMRAEICASLVLSDKNRYRDDVLSRVNEFKAIDIKNMLLERERDKKKKKGAGECSRRSSKTRKDCEEAAVSSKNDGVPAATARNEEAVAPSKASKMSDIVMPKLRIKMKTVEMKMASSGDAAQVIPTSKRIKNLKIGAAPALEKQ